MTDEWGGYWTEVKLQVLKKYLAAFNLASRRAGETVYLDLFAGALAHNRPDTGDTYPGSSALAMRTTPPFSRLVFWELEGPAEQLRRDLEDTFPGDKRYTVVGGDCNDHLDRGLESVRSLRWAPTFAFIDPKGLDVAWQTLERLATWRRDARGRKVELWILMPEPALSRVLGLRGVRGQSSASMLTRLYGCDDWVAIHQRRQSNEFTPEQTRAEFVNLLRWRLTSILGYRTTHPLQLGNVHNQPVYTMVFATDVDAGDSIMRDVYSHAKVREIPTLRSHAVGVRKAKQDRERGIGRLFDPGGPAVAPEPYVYVEPWEPPSRLAGPVELDAEPGPETQTDVEDL